MENLIIIAVLIIIIGLAAGYVIKAKKKGVKCIGCPSGCSCSNKDSKSGASACCSCDCGGAKEE